MSRATFSDENAEKTFSLTLPPNADARARSLRIEVAPSVAGTLVWRARLPDDLSLRLHRTNDVEFPSQRDRFAGVERREDGFDPQHQTIWPRKLQKGIGSSLRLPA